MVTISIGSALLLAAATAYKAKQTDMLEDIQRAYNSQDGVVTALHTFYELLLTWKTHIGID